MPLELEHIFFRLHTHTSRGCARAVPHGGLISIRIALVLGSLTLWAAFLALHLHFVRHALPGALCLPERIALSASGLNSNASFHLMHIDVTHDGEASSAWRLARAAVERWACRSNAATLSIQSAGSSAASESSSTATHAAVSDPRVTSGASAIARLLQARMCRQAARPVGASTDHGMSGKPSQLHRWHGWPDVPRQTENSREASGRIHHCALGSFCGPVLALPCDNLDAAFDSLQPHHTAVPPPLGAELSDASCPVFWQVEEALEAAAAAVKADLGAWLAGGIVQGGWSLAASALSAAKRPLSDAAEAVTASAAHIIAAADDAAGSAVAVCLGASGDACPADAARSAAGASASWQSSGGQSVSGDNVSPSSRGGAAAAQAQAQEEAALLDLQAAWPEADLSVWLPPVEPSYVHAPDRGLLHLAPASRDALRLRRLRLRLSSADPADCLAPHPLLRWLLQSVAGYDTAIINGLLVATGGRGFVTSLLSRETHALASAADVEKATAGGAQSWLLLRAGTLLSAFFLLFACSALVSFILAQTQARMLRFTVALQQHVRSRLPLARLVASHLLDSLIFVPIGLGTLFFLFEYIGDQLLALLLLLLVIGAEVWAATALRTIGSLRFFPRLFVTLLTWFNAYYLSFPFGYHYLALATVAAALAAAMFHLWLRYELPALVRGEVSHTRPRHPLVAHLMQAAPPPLPTAPAHRVAAGAIAAGGATGGGGGTAAIGSPGRVAVPPLDVASAEAAAAALANPSRPRAPSERMSSTGSSGSSTGTRSGSASRRGSSGAASPVVLAGALQAAPQLHAAATQRLSTAGFAAATMSHSTSSSTSASTSSSATLTSSVPASAPGREPVPGRDLDRELESASIAAFAGIAAAAAPAAASGRATAAHAATTDSARASAAAAAASAAFLLDELASLQALVLPSE